MHNLEVEYIHYFFQFPLSVQGIFKHAKTPRLQGFAGL